MTMNQNHPTGAGDQGLARLWNVLRVIGWAAVPVLLLIPAVAMRFTDEVNWTTMDFVFAGAVFVSAGLVLEGVGRASPKPAVRFGAALAVGLIIGLIWAWAVA